MTSKESSPVLVPFPRYSVALLQSESEMMQVPEYDLLPALELDKTWDVELFTERTVDALLDSAERFDCVVVGYNAAHKSDQIRNALTSRPPGVGLLVLHQLEPSGLSFIASEGLRAIRLRPPANHALLVPEVVAHDEILLNWPWRLELTKVDNTRCLPHSIAHLGVVQQPGGTWEAVFETRYGHRRLPVVLRTDARARVATAVCTVLLAPRHEDHLKLLTNLLMWCAAGRPSAVVIEAPGESNASIVHRKLRLQGVKAVVERVAADELDFERWPVWGARDALLPAALDPTQAPGWPREDPCHAKPWLRRGHRIVLLGRDDSLTIRHGESDAHWVAGRWATWFNSVPTVIWHGGRGQPGSIVATRAILRVLSALHRVRRETTLPGLATAHGVLDGLEEAGTGIDPRALGLPEPGRYVQPVGRMLAARIGPDDNVDDTVSATVAALDIDALLGGDVLGDRRGRLKAWLKGRAGTAALEDRLEIARCFGDEELLQDVMKSAANDARIRQPASAVMVTALRSALVACNASPETRLEQFALDPESSVVDDELRMRPMLAAGYLIGVMDLQRLWTTPPSREAALALVAPPAARVDRATITLGRYGPLSRGVSDWRPPVPELASTEALALIAYFAKYPVPTHVVGASDVSAGALHAVLQEASRARVENERLDEAVTEGIEHARRAGRTLALAGEALILAATALFAVAMAPHLPGTWAAPSAFGLFSVLTLGLWALLGSFGMPVRGSARLAPLIAEGWKAVRADLARALASHPSAGQVRQPSRADASARGDDLERPEGTARERSA